MVLRSTLSTISLFQNLSEHNFGLAAHFLSFTSLQPHTDTHLLRLQLDHVYAHKNPDI